MELISGGYMKKKFIKVAMITVLIALILLLFPYVRIFFKYRPSKLICVGHINLNTSPFNIEGGFDKFNSEYIETELNWLSESKSGYIILNQQEKEELIAAVNQYEDYPTVILSKIKSSMFWTRKNTPHIGYMNMHHISHDVWLKYDDVIYVYVTKCTDIDDEPWDWEWYQDYYQ